MVARWYSRLMGDLKVMEVGTFVPPKYVLWMAVGLCCLALVASLFTGGARGVRSDRGLTYVLVIVLGCLGLCLLVVFAFAGNAQKAQRNHKQLVEVLRDGQQSLVEQRRAVHEQQQHIQKTQKKIERCVGELLFGAVCALVAVLLALAAACTVHLR